MNTPATEVEAVFHDGSFHPVNADPARWSEGQHVRLPVQEAAPLPETAPEPPRVPGLHAGKIGISDDFNDPSPDSFWLKER